MNDYVISSEPKPLKPLQPPPRPQHPHRPSHAKLIVPIVVMAILTLGTMAGLLLVRTSQDISQKAASATAKYLFSAPKNELQAGERMDVNVILDPGGNTIAASDMTFTIADPTVAKIIDIKPGTFFNQSTSQGNLAATVLKKECGPSTCRLAVGAACDQCYLGSAPNPNPDNIKSCQSQNITDPKCYPKSTSSSGPIAILTIEALKSGTTTINVANATKTADISSQSNTNDVTGNRSAMTHTIRVTGQSTVACSKYDFNGTNGIDILDAIEVIKRIGIKDNNPSYDAKYDFNGTNGIDILDAIEVIKLIGIPECK